jgi:hypothetical protein
VAIGQLGACEHAGHVALSLRSSDAAARLAALQCLEALNDASQAPAVAALSADPDPRVSALARRMAVGWRVQDTLGHVGASGTALDRILRLGLAAEADDVLLVPGRSPAAKNSSGVSFLTDDALSGEEVRSLLLPILSPSQLAEINSRRDVDFSYAMADGTR